MTLLRLAVVKGDYDAYGGPETLLARLLPHLCAHGVEVVPIVLLRDPASPLPARLAAAAGNAAVVIPWTGPAGAPAVARRLAAVAAARGVDILHTNDMRANLAALLAPRRLAWAAHVHGWLGPTHRGVHRLYEAVDRRIAPRADLVLCGSSATRSELRTAGAKNPVLVPNAIALPAPADPDAVAAIRARVAPGRTLVGVLGRVHFGKGQDVLIEAAARLIAKGRPVAVAIVGDGPFAAELKARAKALGIDDCVTFAGFVDDPAPWLAAMDVACIPSRKESLPLSALEAMGHRRAVIASAVGDLPDAVGDAGVIVPPDDPSALADALDGLIADPARRAALGDAARARIERSYTVDAMAGALAALFRRLVAARTGVAA